MKCILCGSSDLQTVDTIVSDFVMARINENYTGGVVRTIEQSSVIAKTALLRSMITG